MPFEQGLNSTATAGGRALPRVSDVFQTRQQIRAMAGKGAGAPDEMRRPAGIWEKPPWIQRQ
jgi:hypothetical protein